MNDEILDVNEETINYESLAASKGIRFANFLVDGILIGIPLSFLSNFIVIGTFIQEPGRYISIEQQLKMVGLHYLFLIIYYILFEQLGGKTIGKMMTATKVINHQGEKPTLGQIIGRSFARYIPFEAFSFLGEKGIGWHDSLSKTYVIKDR